MAVTPVKPPSPPVTAKPKRLAFSGPELMFREELEKLGAKLEAFIFRPQQEWMGPQYFYRLTLQDGTLKTGNIDWSVETFPKILGLAKEG